jgi:hypothetical protein
MTGERSLPALLATIAALTSFAWALCDLGPHASLIQDAFMLQFALVIVS